MQYRKTTTNDNQASTDGKESKILDYKSSRVDEVVVRALVT